MFGALKADGRTMSAGKIAFIYRADDNGVKQAIPISIKDILNHKRPDVTLRGDDIFGCSGQWLENDTDKSDRTFRGQFLPLETGHSEASWPVPAPDGPI